jgi:hypothetical protein
VPVRPSDYIDIGPYKKRTIEIVERGIAQALDKERKETLFRAFTNILVQQRKE